MDEQSLALGFEKLEIVKEEADRSIMFMNPNSMDATAKDYWELTHAKIIAQSLDSRGGEGGRGGGGDSGRGGGDGGEQGGV
jgi:uncharacterized membrane protein YgcG